MAHYSVATTKDKLSSLIDKALAGEEVIITRHGKPTVEMKIVEGEKRDIKASMAWLAEERDKLPEIGMTALEILRLNDEDAEH